MSIAVVLIVAAHALPSGSVNSDGLDQSSERTRTAGSGIIVGVVVNEHQEPVANAQVFAFSVRTIDQEMRQPRTVPFFMRSSGYVQADTEGRFQFSALEPGEYVVGVNPLNWLPATMQAPLYATTFYPRTIDYRIAAPVSALTLATNPIEIELVRVKGARVAGSVTSRAGRSTTGMEVRVFHGFGGSGSESRGALVGAEGTFEIPRVPPGWVRLTIAPPSSGLNDRAGEFATMLLEVQDRDIDGLSLVLGTGASISGRVVPEPGAGVASAVGMRVSASLTPEYYDSSSRYHSATAGFDWTFRMRGLSGIYQFNASSDRAPFVRATRVTVDGVEKPITAGIELADGTHDVVVFVAPREMRTVNIDSTASPAALVEQFKREKVFWRQSEIAKAIVSRRNVSVLPELEGWLTHEDRHIRGNAALVFSGLGDPRGFQTVVDILNDRSDRPEGQGIATASSDGRYHVERQIRADRYYAAHLLGQLRDPRGVAILVPLLKDPEVTSIVPWALGQIGDKSAVPVLIEALDDDSPSWRVSVIYALETLNAKEALPRLTSLLDDHRKSNSGAQVSVADAARAAIAKLK